MKQYFVKCRQPETNRLPVIVPLTESATRREAVRKAARFNTFHGGKNFYAAKIWMGK